MELTIEQALQQGAALQKEGKLQEAERIYKAILRSHPKHPDASHNLGLIAISMNQIEAALLLFKTALEVDPMIEHFWVSYIDALVKADQLKDAKRLIKKAKKKGFDAKNLQALLLQSKVMVNTKEPSQEQLSTLLEQYQNGRFSMAEKLARSITQEFSKHQFAWKVLGSLLQRTGRTSESLVASQKSVQLASWDGEAHYNLGNTLRELGRLGEAAASYTQSTALKPDLAEAHNNLGITLKQLGRLDEAEASFRQAITLKPDFAEAHTSLGATLQGLGRLEEAESSCNHAIALLPDLAEAHYNLGITLKELGKFDEAASSYKQAISLKSDYAEAHISLLRCLYLMDKQSLFFDQLDYLINEDTANATIGSLTCRSALKYGVEKPNLFCGEPLKYVLHIDMNTQYNFEENFIAKVSLLLNKNEISERKQPLLINGFQTSGNLFDTENRLTDQIQKAIRLEVEKYRINFSNSEEGLIKKWPTKYLLRGWLISMKSGGELKPHIHNSGWLSGSLYINIPPKSNTDSGNLVVSLGEERDATDTGINVAKVINVITGSLVLFPASLTHYTIPFEAEEERIVLAFDVVPS